VRKLARIGSVESPPFARVQPQVPQCVVSRICRIPDHETHAQRFPHSARRMALPVCGLGVSSSCAQNIPVSGSRPGPTSLVGTSLISFYDNGVIRSLVLKISLNLFPLTRAQHLPLERRRRVAVGMPSCLPAIPIVKLLHKHPLPPLPSCLPPPHLGGGVVFHWGAGGGLACY